MNIAAVVVTYNRRDILIDTLRALLQQGDALGAIYLTDNASSDGTKEALQQTGLLTDRRLHYLRLEHNSGGAGGFAHGLQQAFRQGFDAYWLMDDDACPTPRALEHLLDAASGRLDQAAYGSAAVAWSARHEDLVLSCTAVLTQPIAGRPSVIQCHALLPEMAEVENLPFLGFLVSLRPWLDCPMPAISSIATISNMASACVVAGLGSASSRKASSTIPCPKPR